MFLMVENHTPPKCINPRLVKETESYLYQGLKAMDAAQLAEFLFNMREALSLSPVPHKPSMLVHSAVSALRR